MTELADTLARIYSRAEKKAVVSRSTSALTPDGNNTIGIATIKIVTEDQIQAIAFGEIGAPPQIVVRQNPLSRDVADMKSFANFMTDWACSAEVHNGDGRIWVPHADTIEALDILGHRYWRNQTAPEPIVRMGEVCRIVAQEARFPGQQLLADARALLAGHIITGMSPVEEGHLGALLAWLDPAITDPLEDARARIREPASGVLPNTPDKPWDDEIERYRKIAKSASGDTRRHHEEQVRQILHDAVMHEWAMMVEARFRFLELNLPTAGLEQISKKSKTRLSYALTNGYFPARRPDRVVAELKEMEAGQALADHSYVENDAALKEEAVKSGKVVRGNLSEVRQPKPGYRPCNITVTSKQAVIRFRRDDKVKFTGSKVDGIIRGIGRNSDGDTEIEIEIEHGVRSKHVLATGRTVELMSMPFSSVNHNTIREIARREPWLFWEAETPALGSSAHPEDLPLQLAKDRRRT